MDKDVFSSDWHRLFWIYVLKCPQMFSIWRIMTKNYQSHWKYKLHFAAKIWRHKNTLSNIYLIFYENTWELSDTHWLFPLFVFEVKIYLYMQNAVFHFHSRNWALFVHCVHYGIAVKIASCHTQSINSPIALYVNFGLQITLLYHKTLNKQKNVNVDQNYTSNDENFI